MALIRSVTCESALLRRAGERWDDLRDDPARLLAVRAATPASRPRRAVVVRGRPRCLRTSGRLAAGPAPRHGPPSRSRRAWRPALAGRPRGGRTGAGGAGGRAWHQGRPVSRETRTPASG